MAGSIKDKLVGAFQPEVILSNLRAMVDNLIAIPGLLIEGISDLLKSLFIPTENYFSEKFENIRLLLGTKFNLDGLTLSGFRSAELPVFQATIFGKTLKVIDFSWFVPHLNTIHNVARGFVYPLLVFFNIDQVYFLLRGKHFFSKGSE